MRIRPHNQVASIRLMGSIVVYILCAYLGAGFLWFLSYPLTPFLGFMLPLFMLMKHEEGKEPGVVDTWLLRGSIVGAFPAIAFLGNYAISGFVLNQFYAAAINPMKIYIAAISLSAAGCWVFLRYVPQAINRAKSKITKKDALERNRKTDIRDIERMLPAEVGSFDPRKFFKKLSFDAANPPHKMPAGAQIFLGLDEEKQPVFVDYESWKISHVLLTGRTRSGKGVAAQILLGQAIHYGEYLVMLDPKKDNWMPSTFRAACEDAKVPYNFLDLNQTAPPQTNIFDGCDAPTIENMLIGGFSLTEKGDNADFYRLGDRAAAREAAAWLAGNPGATARDCFLAIGQNWEEKAAGFHAAFREMAEIDAINRPSGTGGIEIAGGVQTGGCLYVLGDMINTRIIRLQRMVLLRLLFLAKNRDQINQGRTITVFADEFKVHISRPFMTSLGASAGWGLHTVLAFQSLQDLADCPADLDKDMVRGAVMENCAIQLSYAIKDPETAEWLAASTGKALVDDESRNVRRNIAQAELIDGNRNIRQAERYLIDTNMLMRMPKGCSVLSVVGKLAQFCFTSPTPTKQLPEAMLPTAPTYVGKAGAAGAGPVSLGADLLSEALGGAAPEPDFPPATLAESAPCPAPEPAPAPGGDAAPAARSMLDLGEIPDPNERPDYEEEVSP